MCIRDRAKSLISESNFLLLDEPTNHLDMLSVGILGHALKQYMGTFLIVSHDRHFINKVANKIWWIEDYQLKEYPGTYEEYRWWMSKRVSSNESNSINRKKLNPKSKEKSIKTKSQTNFKRQVADVEGQIKERERLMKSLEIKMTQPDIYHDRDKLSQINDQFQKIRTETELLTKEWEILISSNE